MRSECLSEIVDSIINHISENNPENVYLYGSQARSEANEESDIDFMVVDDKELYHSLSQYAIELTNEYGIEVSVQYTTREIIEKSYLAFWYTFRRDCIAIENL